MIVARPASQNYPSEMRAPSRFLSHEVEPRVHVGQMAMNWREEKSFAKCALDDNLCLVEES